MVRLVLKAYLRLKEFAESTVLSFWGRTYLRAAGVNFEKGLRLYGLPLIAIHRNSKIVIGRNVTLRSRSNGNAIGVNHEVILRTMAENALIQIGDAVGMSGGAICARKSIIVGDSVLIGSNCVLADNDFHPINAAARKSGRDDIMAEEIVIEENVWIGADSYICKGVRIGKNAVVGAKSVVTKSIPANCIAAGVPAKVVKTLSVDDSTCADSPIGGGQPCGFLS
jgi:acetyltransferase-like isoleucine patch superfamily enzyme